MTPAELAESNMRKQTLGTHPPRQRSSRNTRATTCDQSLTTQALTSRISTRSGRNNQVSPRETPSNQVRTNVSPQARPPQTSTGSRAHKQNHPAPQTLHEVRETTHSGATTDGTKEQVTETTVGCLQKTPRENPQNGKH
ncbi:hypothetical protein Taro_025608 [Colocasia esculenta]|uniref:Uncharacterized protein n=1 Tax=Colocasia esculenta TaxID=4460 RepID=A0A843VCQ0_COLES|nr:hypothetical protein [Colocasia esculenta]